MVKKGRLRPVIKESTTESYGAGGVGCCCLRCCTCFHIEFLKTLPGIIKSLEVLTNFIIQGLLINYGLTYHAQIGSAFEGTLTISSACFLNSMILLVCYILSEKSFRLIQSSYFELMFNTIACFFSASSASCLGFATKMFLWPLYAITPGFDVYPAMTAAYYLSGFSAVLYGADTYFAFRKFKG